MLDCKNKILVLFLSFVVGICIGQVINLYFLFENHHLILPFILFESITIVIGAMYGYWISEMLKGNYKI